MAIMEGSDPKEKLEKSYWNGLKANYMVWPVVQAINFRLVPLEHRVLVVNIVSLGKLMSFDLVTSCMCAKLLRYRLELLP